jgi:hypothetical protein
MDKVESTLSRRNLLLVLGGAAAAVGALAATPFRNIVVLRARELIVALPRLRRLVSLANGSYEEWQAQAGSRFALGAGTAIQLNGVRALTSGGVRPAGLGRARAFVAFFDPVAGATMAPELIYTANHPQYGPLQIFLSAAPAPGTPARMMAVFN